MVQISSSYAAHLYQQNQNFVRSPQESGGSNSSPPSPADQQSQSQDTVTITGHNQSSFPFESQEKESRNISDSKDTQGRNPTDGNAELSSEEVIELHKLQARDTEVRAHEQAHLSSAGQYAAGGPSFTFQTGPDGKKYAIGGEVPIDVSKENNPDATILKMRTIRRAALAPANPSSTDRQIAAQAAIYEAQAQLEKRHSAPNETSANEHVERAEPIPGLENSRESQITQPASSQENSTNDPQINISASRRRMMIDTYHKISSLV